MIEVLRIRVSFLLAVALLAIHCSSMCSANDGDRLFTLRVLPLLKEKCLACHGNDASDVKGEFDATSRAHLLEGGESGEPSIVPGNPDDSILYQAVMWEGYEMPPKENDRLTKEQTEYIRRWIELGAPWPGKKHQDQIRRAEWSVRSNEEGEIVDTSGGLSDEWTYRRYQPEDIWAFRPVKNLAQLEKKMPEGVHPIDHFIDAKIKSAKVSSANAADIHTIIRRVTYDLTGLPPTPLEIQKFRQGWKEDPKAAYERLIDRLLASKHYGERWGQHWLDVVRYADTAGFSNDYERSNAWRYRDYVIRSFNDDKPFNRFAIEQIAGDELAMEEQKLKEQTGFSAAEGAVATGFLRMGPWGTAMVPQPEARQLYLDDLVHNTGQSFLSMPMRCCRCHDHKFDPIPTRDYYRLYAAFATTQPAEVPAEFLPNENLKGFDTKRPLVKELLDYATAEQKKIQDKQETAAREWYEQHALPYKNENARKKDPEDEKPPRHVGLTPEEKGMKKVREQDVWIWERRLERYKPMAQSVYNGPDKFTNSRKLRPVAKINQEWRPSTFILTGGSLEAKGSPVGPGVLSGLGLVAAAHKKQEVGDSAADPHRITDEIHGRRLQLARWIASDNNPLTARSFVNRIWQGHFGRGIVGTPNNFGAKGSKPTHPKLLDWLTADFIEHGWRVKRLHRLIMTSNVYRRSGRHDHLEELEAIDPTNRLLARFPARRLTAEEYRDSTLVVSGELNRESGGVPIMPEINMEVALQPRMIQFSVAPAHQPSRTPAERNRRTIYTYRVRGQADPMLEILNLPNPNESCELRDAAAVTPQAFTLMNSDVITDRSIAFALRIQNQKTDLSQQVRRAVHLAFGREASDAEENRLSDYFGKMLTYHKAHRPKAIEYPTQIVRSLVEEFTGEPFEFVELLNVYNDYKPDAKPWTVSAETRALADVCLLLFNSNEFMYVY